MLHALVAAWLMAPQAHAQDDAPQTRPDPAEEPAEPSEEATETTRTRPETEEDTPEPRPQPAPETTPEVRTRPDAELAGLPTIPWYRGWTAPPPVEQLEADGLEVPSGKGALFVPEMVHPDLPYEIATLDGTVIGEGEPGVKFIVDPGTYLVEHTIATEGRVVKAEVTVEEGHIQYVEPPWGLLRVHVVSVQGRFAATDYDIFDVETHHVLAEGHTLEALTENVDTVVVAPGQYKIVRQGAGFHAAVDFVNVLVPEGHVVNAVLVVDPENGQFRGGGVVANEVPEGHDIGGLHVGLSLGGDLMVNQRSHVVGTTDGLSTNIGLFGNFGAVLDTEPHLLSLSTIAELGLGARPFVPVARTHDRLQATALYTYKINNPYIGPYVRAAARTSLFPGYQYFDDETTIILHDANGQPTGETVQVDAADKLRFQVSDSLAPFVLQESLGANLHAVDLATLHVSTRVGYAVRHGWFPGLLVQDETLGAEISSIARFRTVPSYLTHGPEAGADATFKFFRLLYAQGGLNFLVPVEAADHWILDAHASVGVNVGGIASFSYSMRTERDPFVVDSFQLDQTLFARAHWNLL